jgi:hypothetical protein
VAGGAKGKPEEEGEAEADGPPGVEGHEKLDERRRVAR